MTKGKMNTEPLEEGWTADCINVGTFEDILPSLRDFVNNVELAAKENPSKLIGIDCRARSLDLFKVRTLITKEDFPTA